MTAPKAIPGVHLVKCGDPAALAEADDIRDIVNAELHGRMRADYQAVSDKEAERRAEAYFFEVVARTIDARLTWAAGKCKLIETGERDGYFITLRDREGRPYQVSVLYDELAEVAIVQRAHDTERGPELMAELICDRLEAARRHYFMRMIGPDLSA